MADFAGSGPPLGRFGGFRAGQSSCHQPSSHQKQVTECEQREELCAVLGEAPVTGLHMADLALDDAERMLYLGPDLRDDAIGPFVDRMQRAALGGLAQFKRQANDPGDRL